MLIKSIKYVKKQLKELFYKLFSKEKYAEPVLHAAQAKTYIETVSNKADSLHRDINQIYEEDIQKEYLNFMNKLAPKFRRGKVRLGIDFHEIGYYGKKNKPHIIGTAYGNKSYKNAFKYITVSLLTGKKEERVHLYALPWHIGQDLVSTVELLLSAVIHWFDKIEIVQFDRGFYNAELVYWLENNKIPYLIHAKKGGKLISRLVKETKSFYKGVYESKFCRNKSSYMMKTNLFICKNIKNKNWIFVSSLWFTKKEQPVMWYKNRWQIETNYSVNNQNRIMSKSTNYLVRYFYFMCDILLQVLWRLCGLVHLPFKSFLRLFVVELRQLVEMKPNVAGPP